MELLEFSNIEAEQAILCALLIEPELIWTENLFADAFANEKNRLIYQAIYDLAKQKIHPDIIILAEELQRRGIFETCGGYNYIYQLLTSVPSTLYYPEHAKSVLRHYQRRKVFQALQKGIQEVTRDERSVEDIAKDISETLVKSVIADSGVQPVKEIASEVYDEIMEKATNPVEITGVPTGLPMLDKAIGGFHVDDAEVLFIGGEPGIGKTILATQIAVNLANPAIGNAPGVIYSLEMRKKQIVMRMISNLAKLNAYNLSAGKIQGSELELVGACETLYKIPLYISENSALTPGIMRADISRLIQQYGIKWYMLDYIQEMQGYDNLDEIQRSERLSRDLVQICRYFGIGGIIISAVTKDAMDGGIPTKKSLRGSGKIIHDADIVLFLTEYQSGTKTMKADNMRTAMIVKNRNNRSKISFDLTLLGDGIMAFRGVETQTVSLDSLQNIGWKSRKDIE